MFTLSNRMLFSPDDPPAGGGNPPAGDPPKNQPAGDPQKSAFEIWLDKQPEEVRKMYGDHTTGLTSALDTERKARKENEKQLKRLTELEEAEAKRKGEQLSEKEKLEKKLAELESTNSQLSERYASARLRHAVEIAAVTMQFADPEDAYNLADMSGAEIAEDGKITGVKEALEALAKAKPYLIKSGNGKPLGTPQGKPPLKPQPPQTNEPHKPLVRL